MVNEVEKKIQTFNIDAVVKSPKSSVFVIPAKAGIQESQVLMDPRFREGDGLGDFLRICQYSAFVFFIRCWAFDVRCWTFIRKKSPLFQ